MEHLKNCGGVGTPLYLVLCINFIWLSLNCTFISLGHAVQWLELENWLAWGKHKLILCQRITPTRDLQEGEAVTGILEDAEGPKRGLMAQWIGVSLNWLTWQGVSLGKESKPFNGIILRNFCLEAEKMGGDGKQELKGEAREERSRVSSALEVK